MIILPDPSREMGTQEQGGVLLYYMLVSLQDSCLIETEGPLSLRTRDLIRRTPTHASCNRHAHHIIVHLIPGILNE